MRPTAWRLPPSPRADPVPFPPRGPIPVSAVSKTLTGCSVGATPAATTCNGGGFWPDNGASNSFLSTFPNTNQSDNGIGKIDFHPNDKNTINGLLATSRYTGIGEDHPYVNADMLNTFPITVWTTTENWIYAPTSSVVNEVRFGYNRMTIAQDSLDAGLPFPVDTGLTAAPGWPNISIKGFNSFGTQHNRPQISGPNPYSDYQENLSYLKGKHSFKFGIEYGRIEADSNIPDTGRGKFYVQWRQSVCRINPTGRPHGRNAERMASPSSATPTA